MAVVLQLFSLLVASLICCKVKLHMSYRCLTQLENPGFYSMKKLRSIGTSFWRGF